MHACVLKAQKKTESGGLNVPSSEDAKKDVGDRENAHGLRDSISRILDLWNLERGKKKCLHVFKANYKMPRPECFRLRLERSPGEGKGYPLQHSGLENSMDCVVHGVTKSQTRLSDFHLLLV